MEVALVMKNKVGIIFGTHSKLDETSPVVACLMGLM